MPLAEKNKKPVSVYFIVPAPVGISPGQRFRFEHYLLLLQQNNVRFHISSFYSLPAWKNLYKQGQKAQKIFSVLAGFVTRLFDLFKMGSYSFVYLYREAAPVGPPVFEWIIAKVLGKKIIYDFDDAIWVPVTSEYNKAASYFKSFSKIAKICRWSYKVSVGNNFLKGYAQNNNAIVQVIPTVVDTELNHNKLQDQQTDKPAIGWTGSFSTLKYLDMVLPVLQQLQTQYDFTFIVIADKDPMLPLRNYKFIKWNRDSETIDLLSFHIGIMPLYDDEISKGKCGFKAIQYMSLGIPAVVSPVGVNTEIVTNGIEGYVCSNPEEWTKSLGELLITAGLRRQMGTEARIKIEQNYSVKATGKLFLDLFK